MPDSHGHHYCGGLIIEAEISCAIGERDGDEIALLLPGYTCTNCGEPQLHSAEIEVLEQVRGGEPYAGHKHVRLTRSKSSPFAALAV